jgi:DNA-binding transcriptional MerR regulator/methanogenic corrinoid protein MtbC1
MLQGNKAPIYNLKVVLQLTGIKSDTLRAWERRYGLPQPHRTPGGHRLYSQYDIEMIKWFIGRQDEGMRINRAIELWRSIDCDGRDPLDEINPIGQIKPLLEQTVIIGNSLQEIRKCWVTACLAFNEPLAERTLSHSFALFPVESVCLEVIQKGITEIGEEWYRGDSTVQQEHFASNLAVRRLDAVISAAPFPSRPEKIIIGCPLGEEHTLSPLIATLFLRRHGWDVIYLGANVPFVDLENTARQTGARLVIMIATQLHTAANLYDIAISFQKTSISLAFAGSVFLRIPQLFERIPGYFLGNQLDRVVLSVEDVLLHSSHQTIQPNLTNEHERLIKELCKKQSLIQANVWNEINQNGTKYMMFNTTNKTMIRDILSALRLGSVDYMTNEIEWLNKWMHNLEISQSLLPEYLKLFGKAIEQVLGDVGNPIIKWLNQSVQRLEGEN